MLEDDYMYQEDFNISKFDFTPVYDNTVNEDAYNALHEYGYDENFDNYDEDCDFDERY